MLVYICVQSVCLCDAARHVVADITSRPDTLKQCLFQPACLKHNKKKVNGERRFKLDKKFKFENHDFLGICPLEISALGSF